MCHRPETSELFETGCSCTFKTAMHRKRFDCARRRRDTPHLRKSSRKLRPWAQICRIAAPAVDRHRGAIARRARARCGRVAGNSRRRARRCESLPRVWACSEFVATACLRAPAVAARAGSQRRAVRARSGRLVRARHSRARQRRERSRSDGVAAPLPQAAHGAHRVARHRRLGRPRRDPARSFGARRCVHRVRLHIYV